MELKDFFTKNKKAAIAFSGGVDSSYLLYAAKDAGADVTAYYIKTEFQPQFEYSDAVKLCDELGARLKAVEYNILSEESVRNNHRDRCYHCKKVMFSILKREAEKDGYKLLLDGTNASDNADDRPGMKALSELSVRSPLRECGLTKDKIRELSKKAGLFTWNKPAYACLATRVQSGTEITEDLLREIEGAESALMSMGFTDVRVRSYNGCARIQIKRGQFAMAADRRADIVKALKPYFDIILLDMEAR